MATYTKYEQAIENLANKLIDAFGSTDTWKAVIHTDAPVVATDNVLGDVTQIAGSNGYTTGGSDITSTPPRAPTSPQLHHHPRHGHRDRHRRGMDRERWQSRRFHHRALFHLLRR